MACTPEEGEDEEQQQQLQNTAFIAFLSPGVRPPYTLTHVCF
jgi:hypothetical protein